MSGSMAKASSPFLTSSRSQNAIMAKYKTKTNIRQCVFIVTTLTSFLAMSPWLDRHRMKSKDVPNAHLCVCINICPSDTQDTFKSTKT